MKNIHEIINLIASNRDCSLYQAQGRPTIQPSCLLPEDLGAFYDTCGGAELFVDSEYPLIISPPQQFVLSNKIIVGEIIEDDITSSWYIVAKGRSDEFISIDCCESKLGTCYDSYVDRHGVAGSCPIIASSFSEFLENCLACGGKRYFWLQESFLSIGDAYD